jgi:hypothetical protein
MPDANRWALGALLVVAGVIHLVMAPSHMADSTVEGLSFLAAGWVQVALGAFIVARPERWVLWAVVATNAVFVGAWAVSRVWGLPYGAHARQAAESTFVDLACVGLELAAMATAAVLLLRPDFGTRAVGITIGVPVLALFVGTAAIASPSARDHAAHSHAAHDIESAADGHEHTHADAATVDDMGLSQLMNGHQHETGEVALDPATQARLDAQLALTLELVARYPTIAAAEAAGYTRSGPFAPGLGIHYSPPEYHLNPDGIIDDDDIPWPMLVFDGIGPDAPLAGFMYLSYSQEVPEGFAGPNDHWHYHERVCIVMRPDGSGIDTPFGADLEGVTDAMCDRAGGLFIDNTGYMVHVWTVPGYESDRGVFSEINPKITCPDGTYYTIPLEELGDRLTTCRSAV